MMLIVDPWHWLNADGSLPVNNLPLRRQVLRVARLIEYGGPLAQGNTRETLVECTRRRDRNPCPGFLVVEKTADDRIHANCGVCGNDELLISNWHDTPWADGMLGPLDTVAPRPSALN